MPGTALRIVNDPLQCAPPAVYSWPVHRFTFMIATTFLLIWKLLLPLLVMVALIDWLTASDDRRIRILRSTGLSQRAIADRLNLSRYRVRQALAS